jgi:hypothetical protein
MRYGVLAAVIAVAMTAGVPAALAQDVQAGDAGATAERDDMAVDETPPPVSIEDRGELRVDPMTITVPSIAFVEKPEHVANYDKYFFFHREGTDFETALADVRECDDYARGISYHTSYANPYMYGYYGQYGMVGALGAGIGAAIGNAIADAVFGSAHRRRMRWQNLRICMGYKEYQRYGLPKDIWEEFNFSEGNARVSERKRLGFLQQQARIASGPKPAGKALDQ